MQRWDRVTSLFIGVAVKCDRVVASLRCKNVDCLLRVEPRGRGLLRTLEIRRVFVPLWRTVASVAELKTVFVVRKVRRLRGLAHEMLTEGLAQD